MALTDNLRTRYSFDDDNNDALWDNNLSSSWASYTTGVIDKSVICSSDRYTWAITAVTGNWTISFWAYRTWAWNDNGTIIEIWTVGSWWFWVIIWATWNFWITAGSIDWHTWVHVAIVYNWTNVKTYKNWTEVSSISFTTNPSSQTVTCYWDRRWAAWNYYNGNLDLVWIWARDLSSTEVTQLYNSWAWLDYPFAWWTFTPKIIQF